MNVTPTKLLRKAGLYSAVLSAFIIESYGSLKPDPNDQMIYLFQQMISQNYTVSSGFLNATNPYPSLPPFEVPTWALRVNLLWFSSLVASVAAASYGMLMKQWLREYLDMAKYTSPHERLRARQFRRPALEHWKVFQIAASLPLLLEIALALFFAGLCYFTQAIHSGLSASTFTFVAAWAAFFLVATIAPLASPRCPFKTTILKGVIECARRLVVWIARRTIPIYVFFAHYTTTLSKTMSHLKSRITNAVKLLKASFLVKLLFSSLIAIILAPFKSLSSALGLDARIDDLTERFEDHMQEEKTVLGKQQDDMTILRSVEDIMPGDGLLPTVVDIACVVKPSWKDSFSFIADVVANRTSRSFDKERRSWIVELQSLSPQVCDALTVWTSNILRDHSTHTYLDSDGFLDCSALFLSLIASHDRPLLEPHEDVLRNLIYYSQKWMTALLPDFLSSGSFRDRLGNLFFTNCSSTKWPTLEAYHTWSLIVDGAIVRCDPLTDTAGDLMLWVGDALALLVASWKTSFSPGQEKKNRSPQPFTSQLIDTILAPSCNFTDRAYYGHGRIYCRADPDKVDIYYGILLGATRTTPETQYPLRLHTRNLRSILTVRATGSWESPRRNDIDDCYTPRTRFLASAAARSRSAVWVPNLLGWLSPRRMPGNVLAEIVIETLQASDYDGERVITFTVVLTNLCCPEKLRKLDGILEVCRIASRIPRASRREATIDTAATVAPDADPNVPATVAPEADPNVPGEKTPTTESSLTEAKSAPLIDFSSLLQISMGLQRLVGHDVDVDKKIGDIQQAFHRAILHRRAWYTIINATRLRDAGSASSPSPPDEYFRDLRDRRLSERVDLVYRVCVAVGRMRQMAQDSAESAQKSRGRTKLEQAVHIGRGKNAHTTPLRFSRRMTEAILHTAAPSLQSARSL